ncbi:hypothetical protein HMPREF9372_0425 [Sporosarcina newyorkensis 2681]|uniref:Uncharacterized protein n=1 Tax=Sporosarcina newyorkensis 2681 TaxID=1027292 RepID=F9DNP5_9BACL|nr:hypothetical protein HMPREF9372_0425 [Sporosarcina newyorkensis 2681]
MKLINSFSDTKKEPPEKSCKNDFSGGFYLVIVGLGRIRG